ncbi:DUF927 domain-containing protein [Defluviitalea phaphyphila]|uniref:DUF927 domain-containing protein n=1 Tax=Defluviitalea phaphyphila TaxID=1473580 RepID=UPI000730BD0F|nr:DUF927 domain-containing protein [Defluviitalea phaphyphila]
MKYFSKDEIVIVENDKNGWYQKAIFILNKDCINKKPKDIVAEAEKIIHKYMKKNKLKYYSKKYKKTKVDLILNISLILSIVLFIYCISKII